MTDVLDAQPHQVAQPQFTRASAETAAVIHIKVMPDRRHRAAEHERVIRETPCRILTQHFLETLRDYLARINDDKAFEPHEALRRAGKA